LPFEVYRPLSVVLFSGTQIGFDFQRDLSGAFGMRSRPPSMR
jgi:hypothetical protein